MNSKNIPFFMDVTLRDGNQALKKPWNVSEKVLVFQKLVDLGVQGAEVGFASASALDFESVREICKIAPERMVISSLSRAVEKEIDASIAALSRASRPSIHIVFPVSTFAIEKVLKLDPQSAKKMAISSVRYARKKLPKDGRIQFSGEHFGDSGNNLNFVLEIFNSVLQEGAEVINLPNTVERGRPSEFVSLVKIVKDSLPINTILSVHTHNDLGMATATTVESFFAGVTQLEVTLNGLGERAGNTNLYEVATALKNCGIDVPLNMSTFCDISRFIASMSGIPVPEKAPIVGLDVFSHRSGIHQDGVMKTMGDNKNLYGAFRPEDVGRNDGHVIQFTSQSGKAAISGVMEKNGLNYQKNLIEFQMFLKEYSAKKDRVLEEEEILTLYNSFLSTQS